MKEPDFDEAYRAAKRAAYGQSIARLHHLSHYFADTLGAALGSRAFFTISRTSAASVGAW
jgi:hypothetical protein